MQRRVGLVDVYTKGAMMELGTLGQAEDGPQDSSIGVSWTSQPDPEPHTNL